MLNTDKPIEDISDDKLGRADFVKRVSKAIYEFNSTDNFTIALQGKWGCGKTSILNMIANEITTKSDSTIIVKFDPWNFTDCNQLINQFFVNLSTELKKQSDNEGVKKDKKIEIGAELGRVIDKYSFALEYAKYIPTIGKYLKIIPQLTSSVVTSVSEAINSKLNDVTYQKNSLTEMLKESKSRIVIMIDDIDRLTDEQIKLIFQLVSSVAGFPNITYLLSYDKDIVVRALNDVQGKNGEEYLEKIVQLSFDVPYVKTSKIKDLLIEKIKETIVLKDEELDTDYWHTILNHCILPLITSVRNIVRYVNALSFSYYPVKDEVCFADMAAICSYQLFAPKVYKWILDNKYSLTGGYNQEVIYNKSIEDNRKNSFKLFKPIFSGNTDVIIKSLSILFPKFNNSVSQNINYTTTLDLRKNKRVASSERFDVYFSNNLDDVKISDAEFKRSINEMNEMQLREYLHSIKKQNLIFDYKKELELYLKDIDENRIELLLSVLMFSSGRINSLDPLCEYNDHIIDVYFLEKILKQIKDENCRYEIIKNIMTRSDFLSFQKLLHLMQILEIRCGKIKASLYVEEMINADQMKDLENVVINRMKQQSKESSVFDWRDYHRSLLLWELIDKESYYTYIQNAIKTPVYAIILVALNIAEWSTENYVCEYELKDMSECMYNDFISDNTVLEYIETERNSESFWKLEDKIIRKAIAFYLIKKSDSKLIDASVVDSKYEEWKNDYTNERNLI